MEGEPQEDTYAGVKRLRSLLVVVTVIFAIVFAAYHMVTLNFLRDEIEKASNGMVKVRGDIKLGLDGLRPTIIFNDLAAEGVTLGSLEMRIPFAKPTPGNAVETRVKLAALSFPERPPINVDIPVKSDSIDSSIDNFEARSGETVMTGSLSYKPGQVNANADIDALDYGLLYPGGSGGAGTGKLTLTGMGMNQHLVVGTLQGHLLLEGGKGKIPGRALALWGGSVLGALLTPEAAVNCAVAELDIAGGVATVKRLAVDTDVMNITAAGNIDFNTAQINIVFTPQPKQAGGMSTAVPILVSGPIGRANGEPVGEPVAYDAGVQSPCGAKS